MGSLMAGWNSPSADSKAVAYQRSRSFTKDEIEAYWKSKKKNEEEHLGTVSVHSNNSQENQSEGSFKRSNSSPLGQARESLMNMEMETNLEKLNKNGWWRRSNWAFLNEPPVSEGASKTCTSQFHVPTTSLTTSQP